MRLTALLLLASFSGMLRAPASAATRPHYGGTLRIALHAAPTTLDPADPALGDSVAAENISRLVFDTLTVLDDHGVPKPALTSSWSAEPGNQRWRFMPRNDVKFQDGSSLTPEAAASSLRAANPEWKVFSTGGAVIIETASAAPYLPAELALTRNGIAKREGKLMGTGPFAIAEWDLGKKLTLTAREDYWGGRPFLDSIVIELGKSFREQMISLDLGRVDVIEVAAEQALRGVAEGRRVRSSPPQELIAVVFAQDPRSEEEAHMRQALSSSIDRAAINAVLFQARGEPAAGLLPNWMTGYEFLFAKDFNLQEARQVRAQNSIGLTWTLGYDRNDAAARLLAERIALSASDAGLELRVANSKTPDARLVRVPVTSLDGEVALRKLAALLGLPQPIFNGNSPEELYAAEAAPLKSGRVIPLLHVRASYALSDAVKNWAEERDGSWRLEDVWVEAGKP